MQVRALSNNSRFPDRKARPGVIVGLLAGACVLGMAVIAIGARSNVNAMAIGILALIGLAGSALLVLDVPLIAILRFTFIASFFFKGDLMLFKIDEIEDPSGLNISLTLATAVCLLIYDHYVDEQSERVFSRSVTLLFLALFTCAAVSVIFGGSTLLGGFSIFSFLTSVLVAYVTASHFSRRDRMTQLILFIGVGLVFTGVVAFSQYAFEWPMNLSAFGTGTEEEQLGTQSAQLARVPAFLRTPNGMAWVVSSLVPLILAPIICRVKNLTTLQRMFLFVAALTGTVGIILSLARGSWIGLVAAIALLVLAGWYRLSTSERKGYFVSAFAVIAFAVILLIPFSDRIYDRLTEDDQGAAAIRLPLMETALSMIDDNPLTGVGLNGYRSNMIRYDDTDIFVSQVFRNPVHNIFAHVTAEIGLPGGILFCLLILAALIECFRTMTSHDRWMFALALGTAIGLIAFIISGIKEPGSLGSVRPPVRTLFLLLGIAFALARIRRRSTASAF